MKTETSKAQEKFQTVMHEFGEGKLRSHDKPVTDQRQALAIAFHEARKVQPGYAKNRTGTFDYMHDGGKAGERAAELARIYKKGKASELWAFWNPAERTHFLIDHSGQFFEIMGDDYKKSADAYITLTYDTLPSPIRKEIVIHQAQGMYQDGGRIPDDIDSEISSKYNIGRWGNNGHFIHSDSGIRLKVFNDSDSDIENWKEAVKWGEDNINKIKDNDSEKQKIRNRIDTLKQSLSSASASAKKTIEKKIQKLQDQLDYKPSSKEKVKDNEGKFALDVPVEYSKGIYKKLWKMKILPRIHKMKDTASIIVNGKANLQKAYDVYSGILKEEGKKSPALSKISRKL